jgi:hypothetical protein
LDKEKPAEKIDRPQEYYDKYKMQTNNACTMSNFKQAVESQGYMKRNNGNKSIATLILHQP